MSKKLLIQTSVMDRPRLDRIKALAAFAIAYPLSHKKARKKYEQIYPILLTKFIYLGGDKPDAADRVNHIQ